MNTIEKTQTTSTADAIVIKRTFDAPRELVWKAWTEPEHFRAWWAPKEYSTPVVRIDLRPGGELFFCLRSSDGNNIWCRGVYQEVDPPSRLVFTDMLADEAGNRVSPEHYGMTGLPLEMLVTVTFEDVDGKTAMTMTHTFPASVPEHQEGALQGWGESFDKLERYLQTLSSRNHK